MNPGKWAVLQGEGVYRGGGDRPFSSDTLSVLHCFPNELCILVAVDTGAQLFGFLDELRLAVDADEVDLSLYPIHHDLEVENEVNPMLSSSYLGAWH